MTLLRALDGDLGERPDAIRLGDETISWSGLADAADAIGARIAGAPAVAVRAVPSIGMLAAVVGALRARVPVVPMPSDAGEGEIAYMLADSGAVLLDGEGRPAAQAAASTARIDPGVALILYTSGTTGRPKGVQLTTGAIAANIDALALAWGWAPDDVLAHGLPLSHVHGLVLGVLGPLRVGSRLVHTIRPAPAAYAAAGGTMYFGVPTVWSRICAEPDSARALSGARLLVSGSAGLPSPIFQAIERLTGHRPIERYGMTETLITCSTRADGMRMPGCVGMPLPGVHTRLAPAESDEGDAAADDGLGALEVSSPSEFIGYLGRPDADAAARTADGWFRTGDIATIDGDGVHRIVGRASSDLIKSGGYRIGAGEIEDALLAHPAVREAAVVGVPDDDLGQRIVAYVVADGIDAGALIAFATARLSRHKAPRGVVFLDELPRNAMGKVTKSALAR
jgi:fatty acid CoA ligase FadD36